jgi:hypothetical protein
MTATHHGLWVENLHNAHALDLLRGEQAKLDLLDGLEGRVRVREVEIRHLCGCVGWRVGECRLWRGTQGVLSKGMGWSDGPRCVGRFNTLLRATDFFHSGNTHKHHQHTEHRVTATSFLFYYSPKSCLRCAFDEGKGLPPCWPPPRRVRKSRREGRDGCHRPLRFCACCGGMFPWVYGCLRDGTSRSAAPTIQCGRWVMGDGEWC